MSEIKTFPFDLGGVEEIKKYKYGSDWPIVYLIENGMDLYVGETIRAYARTLQHLDNARRRNLRSIHIISDDEANKSSTLDIESSLIEYLVADSKYVLQNGNSGMQNHNYYDRERYEAKFEMLWKDLQRLGLAKNDLLQIRNSDLFKYSPYKTLTDDQFLIATKLLNHFENDGRQIYIIKGGPGTGKTILATFLMKQLVDKGIKNVAMVIAMSSLRKTLKKVFKNVPGLSSKMVIGPNEVIQKNYEILIVDEAHRLRRRKNIPNFGSFDASNRILGFDNSGTELDWIVASAQKVVLFYDERQSVRPSDISRDKVNQFDSVVYELKTQMRVKGGEEYLSFIDYLLESKIPEKNFHNYDFRIYENLGKMIRDIREREKKFSLCRLVAGYAWKWVSKSDSKKFDIEIDGQKLYWNSNVHDWVNSPNAINEVGCIHTIQGYDLNYAGVIIGPELGYDPIKKQIVIDKTKYFDTNGYRGVEDPEELKRYIINIYKTLMTRGILGTYVYVVDDNFREYVKSVVK